MNSVKIDPAQIRLAQELKHNSPLIGCRFDPTGRFVFAGAQDNSVQRWELAGGKKTELVGHKSWIRAITFSSPAKKVFTADWAGKIICWASEDQNPKPLFTINAHDGWVRALAVSPDGNMLASCGNDNLVRLWSVHDGKPMATLSGHTSHVYNVAFHPDGKSVVSGDLKGAVRIWDLSKMALIREMDGKILHKYDSGFCADIGGIRSMAFNTDGSLVACAGITEVSNAFAGVGKPLVVLFETATGKTRQLLKPKADFQGTCWGVIYHKDGFFAGVGGGNGGAVWFWKPDNPVSFHTFALPDNGRDLDLHQDGKRLAIPFFDGSLRIYDMTAKA